MLVNYAIYSNLNIASLLLSSLLLEKRLVRLISFCSWRRGSLSYTARTLSWYENICHGRYTRKAKFLVLEL
jgi:hypothetical protein